MGYEILGANELLISGDLDLSDDSAGAYEILAGPGRHAAHRGHGGGRMSRAQILRQAALAKQAASGSVVRQQSPTKSRRQVLPMASSGTVAANTSTTITSRPQSFAFRPERIVIPATIAPDFTVDDIKVGNTSQLVQSGSLPAEMFVQGSFDACMEMDTVQTSQDFVLAVTNQSGAARTFRAGIVGRSLNQ
jgi:hypothetical protein